MLKKIWRSNSIWAVIAQVVGSGITFIAAPIISQKVGIEAYGYVSLAQNILMYIGTIVIAFNYFSERNITVSYHRREIESAKSFFSSILVADAAIFIIVFVPSIFLIYNLQNLLKISPILEKDIKWLFFFMLLIYFAALFGTTLEVAGVVSNRIDINSKNRTLSSLIHFSILITLLWLTTPHIWYVGLGHLIASVIFFLIQLTVKKRLLPDLNFSRKLVSIERILTQIKSGVWVALNNLGNILNDGLDLLITNLMISEYTMGVISIAKLFGNFSYAVVVAIGNSLRGTQIKAYAAGDTDLLVYRLKRSMKITGVAFCLIYGGFCGWGKFFLSIWLKGEDIAYIYKMSVLSLSANIITSIVAPLYYIYTLYEKMRVPCFITIGMGIFNVISMYLLIKFTTTGGYAVLLTTCIINSLHLIDAPIYSAFCMGIKKTTFYPTIARIFSFFIIYVIIAEIINSVWNPIGIIQMFIKATCYIVMGVLISFVIVANKDEQLLILSIVRKR